MMQQQYWERMDPDADDIPDTDNLGLDTVAEAVVNQKGRFNTVQQIIKSLDYSVLPPRIYDTRISTDFSRLRNDLVSSFSAQYKNGLICKPYSAKTRKPLLNVLSRVELESNFSLVVKESTFHVSG